MGNIPSQAILISGSLNRSASSFSPMLSIISFIMIFTKIRLLEVVSSSLILMQRMTVQVMASEERRYPKNLAMFRRRFVSYRWIVS